MTCHQNPGPADECFYIVYTIDIVDASNIKFPKDILKFMTRFWK